MVAYSSSKTLQLFRVLKLNVPKRGGPANIFGRSPPGALTCELHWRSLASRFWLMADIERPRSRESAEAGRPDHIGGCWQHFARQGFDEARLRTRRSKTSV
jgi:hypothetical protein